MAILAENYGSFTGIEEKASRLEDALVALKVTVTMGALLAQRHGDSNMVCGRLIQEV